MKIIFCEQNVVLYCRLVNYYVMKDLNGFITGITLDNGNDINVDIEPVTLEVEGNIVSNGVYNLYNDESREPLGQICFNVEDASDWMYIDEQLSQNESEQIAAAIQKD